MNSLLSTVRRTGFLILVGALLIILVAMGIIYLQQGAKQGDLEEQSAKLSLVVAKPLPDAKELKAKYDEVNQALAPLDVPAALEMIVGIAHDSGIDTTAGSGKLTIPPPAKPKAQKVGEGSYQVLSLNSVKVLGDYDSVVAFISAIDSGNTPETKTMVLKRLDIRQAQVARGKQQAEPETVAILDLDLYMKAK
ncbi:MAG: hypothetical protein HY530_00530 [Chloroflexi bacterium]|nr:hypothetical protein [Chloroflexota bacterium]